MDEFFVYWFELVSFLFDLYFCVKTKNKSLLFETP